MKKRDYILIGCILLVAAVCAGFFLLTGKEAQDPSADFSLFNRRVHKRIGITIITAD